MSDYTTFLSRTKEFIELKKMNSRYAGALARYKNYTVSEYINAYNANENGIQGKDVYDQLMAALAPEQMKEKNIEPVAPPKYSFEDLLLQKKRQLPYVSNMHQSIGKLMDVAISQAIKITVDHAEKPTSVKYGNALQLFFNEHLDKMEIVKCLGCTPEHVRTSLIGNFIEGKKYVEGISIYEPFKQDVIFKIASLTYHAVDEFFEENEIDTHEKREFACALAGKDFFDDMKEWGNAFVITEKEEISITKKHLISLKIAICNAIVPVELADLVERTKKDFIKKSDFSTFNSQIIESFVKSHPWIDTDEDGKYYILTRYLTATYQRQGRIIYEAGQPIHHSKVRSTYQTIFGEDYNTPGIQNSLTKRTEHDFFPYGKTGLWYYSENGKEIKPANKVISKFVDEHICFYWKDLATVAGQLYAINEKSTIRRIRMEITNLCFVDNNDKDHFVKKGEEGKYPSFSWGRSKKNRTNWSVNHAYEILKESPNGEMKWKEFEKQFKQDLEETDRPLKVVEDIKYKHSGSAEEDCVFILENNIIRINEDVVEKKFNGNLSMYGLYRKYPKYYNSIFSLAMTELRKRQDNIMKLTDLISLAIKNIESEDVKDSNYVRKIFDNNDKLPKGLSRYNDNGTVYIKYDPTIADDEDTDDMLQYVVTAQPSNNVQTAPQLEVVAEETRQPVTYTTRFNWNDVKKALKSDLTFYESSFWYKGITSDGVLDKFTKFLSSSENYNLNDLVPQIIYEFHYARIDRYDLYQYMRNLTVAFEALLREIYESAHRPIKTNGIKNLCEMGFTEFDNALTYHEKKGFGRILNDLVYKRNHLLHGVNLELPIVTINQNIVEYIALFVYTVDKYSLNLD